MIRTVRRLTALVGADYGSGPRLAKRRAARHRGVCGACAPACRVRCYRRSAQAGYGAVVRRNRREALIFTSSRGRLLLAAATIAIAAGALVPASASAIQLTITDDAGNPVPFNGEPAIRNMSPSVGIGFSPNEKANYSASFAGPDGVGTSAPIGCYSIASKRSPDYRGNGTYSVTIQKYGGSDYNCKTPVGSPQVYKYSINGSVSLGAPPAPRVLIRDANSFVTRPVVLPFAGNPGALGNEIRYALNGAVGPDGAIAGPSAEGFVDSATGTVPLRITAPGRYVAVARAKGFSSSTGQFFTPWTAPVTVDAVSPFDIESFRTPDARGPSYRVRVQIRDRTARGRVSIAYARGRKGGRYRSLGSVKISSKATFSKRLTLRRSGSYRLRVRFKGSPTVAGGTVVSRFRITRRFAF